MSKVKVTTFLIAIVAIILFVMVVISPGKQSTLSNTKEPYYKDGNGTYMVTYSEDFVPEKSEQNLAPILDSVSFFKKENTDALAPLTINTLKGTREEYLNTLLSRGLVELDHSSLSTPTMDWLIVRLQNPKTTLISRSALASHAGKTFQIVFFEGSTDELMLFNTLVKTFVPLE